MIDKLPPMWRALIYMLAAALLSWASTDLVPSLPPGAAAIVGPIVGVLLFAVTPLTGKFGAFKTPNALPPRR